MPELPEIETLARDLRKSVKGKTIVDAFVGQPKAINLSIDEFRKAVRGRVEAVDRLGKSAILSLPDGELWLHLGLRGRVTLVGDQPWPAAKFIALRFSDDTQLSIDKVFMGHAYFVAPGARPPGEALGTDALDDKLTLDRFTKILRAKPGLAIKPALMNQSLIAGVGNTYSDELLARAHVYPGKSIGSLTDEEIARVYRAMRETLEQAISAGGEQGWFDFAGREGAYRTAVHQAEKCGVCGGPVKELTIGSRTGHFCPRCQKQDEGSSRDD